MEEPVSARTKVPTERNPLAKKADKCGLGCVAPLGIPSILNQKFSVP
jgi:hypothetical protein